MINIRQIETARKIIEAEVNFAEVEKKTSSRSFELLYEIHEKMKKLISKIKKENIYKKFP